VHKDYGMNLHLCFLQAGVKSKFTNICTTATGLLFALQTSKTTHFAGVNFNPTKEQGSHGKNNLIF